MQAAAQLATNICHTLEFFSNADCQCQKVNAPFGVKLPSNFKLLLTDASRT